MTHRTPPHPVTLTPDDLARIRRLLSGIDGNASYLGNYARDVEESESASAIRDRVRKIGAVLDAGEGRVAA